MKRRSDFYRPGTVVWILVLLCVLSGCGGSEQDSSQPPLDVAHQQPPPLIAPPVQPQSQEPPPLLPTPPASEIVYTLEDFEDYTPSVWAFRPGAKGTSVQETTIVHSGKRAARVGWDFSECPEDDKGFVNFFFHREMVGQPQALKVWVYCETAETTPTSIQLWLEDLSSEVFLSDATADWTGWKQVTFDVEKASSRWESVPRRR